MRPLNVTLEGLIALVTVAQEGSLARGGRVLGRGISTVNKQITALEDEVGTPLFDRWRGRWYLNEDGRLLAARAFQAIMEIRMGLDLVQSHVRLRTEHFAVGYSTFLSPILIGIIKQIELKRHGDVTITYESRLTEPAIERVVRGELDAGFGYLPIREPELLVRKVFEEPLAVCLPKSHPLAGKGSVSPEKLEGLPMVTVGRYALPLLFEETEEHFQSLGIELQYVEDCLSPAEALASVARGTGFCLLPVSVARMGRGVVMRSLEDRFLTHKSGVFVRQDSDDPLVKDFLELVTLRTTPYHGRPERSHHQD